MGSSTNECAIRVDELEVRYGAFCAVDRLSFEVASGEVLALLGPNGAGKTSTIETMEGYIKPSAGSVAVLGMEPFRSQARLSRSMGVMLQEGGIPPRMTVRAALRLYSSFYDDPVDAGELVSQLDLGRVEKTMFRRLSGGEKQRLLLALAIVGRPRVLFLDEPTAGVDPVGKVAIRELVSALRDDGLAIVISGHELEEIDRMVDRVLIIDHGRELAHGSVEELKSRYGTECVEFSTRASLDLQVLSTRLGVDVEKIGDGRYRVGASASPALLSSLAAALEDLEISSIETVAATLESIYLSLVGGSKE